MPKPKRVRETENKLGQKINAVMDAKGIPGDYAAVAKHFGVATTSVYGWIDHGRIGKERLSQLSAWSGRPITWWLSDNDTLGPSDDLQDAFNDWRLQASPKSLAVIDQLTTAAQLNAISDEDWELLQSLAARFGRK